MAAQAGVAFHIDLVLPNAIGGVLLYGIPKSSANKLRGIMQGRRAMPGIDELTGLCHWKMTHNRINALLDLNAVDATGETEKWEKARKLAEAISTRGIRNIWV